MNLHPGLVADLAHQPIWLLGILASVAGFGFQAVALWKGSLSVVQPLLVLGLVFALPLSAATLSKRWLSAKEWVATVTVTGGLAVFLLTGDPSQGKSEVGLAPWFLVVAIILCISFAIVLISKFQKGPVRSVMQATAAGLVNSLAAAFTKSAAHHFSQLNALHSGIFSSLSHAVWSWQIPAVVVDYCIVLLLVQSAFQGEQIGWSLPALTVANPAASLFIGAYLFHENLNTSPIGLAIQAISIGVIVIGITILAKIPGHFESKST